MPGVVPRRMAQRTWWKIHLRTTSSPIHFAVQPRTNRGLTSTPTRDVLLGDFVLCRLSHNNHLPVWLGRALTCVDNTPGDNYGRFTVEWWTPMKGKREGKRAS
jgi:hypothetical protein